MFTWHCEGHLLEAAFSELLGRVLGCVLEGLELVEAGFTAY